MKNLVSALCFTVKVYRLYNEWNKYSPGHAIIFFILVMAACQLLQYFHLQLQVVTDNGYFSRLFQCCSLMHPGQPVSGGNLLHWNGKLQWHTGYGLYKYEALKGRIAYLFYIRSKPEPSSIPIIQQEQYPVERILFSANRIARHRPHQYGLFRDSIPLSSLFRATSGGSLSIISAFMCGWQ